jgi:UDP:flavonoid glycosyltransferase YjiC (YdhE family)
MRFVLANWGTRGEMEPFAAIGRELVGRGHDVCLAVAPELVDFAKTSGAEAVGYGPTLEAVLRPHHEYWTLLFTKPWRLQELNRLMADFSTPLAECREQARDVLLSLSDGADLLLTGMNYEDAASNVAERCGTPLATLQVFPLRANGYQLPFLPAPVCRAVMAAGEWLTERGHRAAEDAERAALGLPEARGHWTKRIAALDAIEIQAYDSVCYPGLATEWAEWNSHPIPKRPFIGPLTMELPSEQDAEVTSWIAAGKPPIFFGFGSMPIDPAEAIPMIAGACRRLGERALIGAGWADITDAPRYDHVKVVGTINYAEVFPLCRAVVHHGGAGTVHAGLRAGCPTLLLWMLPDQACWASQLRRLEVGTGRRFVTTTEETLVDDLRTILAPEYLDRARELATGMTKPAENVVAAADLVERFAASRRG